MSRATTRCLAIVLAIITVTCCPSTRTSASPAAPATRATSPARSAPRARTVPIARDPRWERVDAELSASRPEAAIDTLRAIELRAIRSKDWGEAVSALRRRVDLQARTAPVTPEQWFARMDGEIAGVPTPMRPLLEVIQARWLWQYFRANQGRIAGRTQGAAALGTGLASYDLTRIHDEIITRFERALAHPDSLGREPVTAYEAWLMSGSMPDRYRPTLFDFLAHEAIDFYFADEQGAHRASDAYDLRSDGPVFAPAREFMRWQISATDSASATIRALRLCQRLLEFHAKDRDAGAFVDVDRYRLRLARIVAVGENTDARYIDALTQSYERYPDEEMSALSRFEVAQVLYERGALGRARTVARVAVQRYPNSVGARFCAPLMERCGGSELKIETPLVWNDPLPGITVKYRNIPVLYLRLVRTENTGPDSVGRGTHRHAVQKAPDDLLKRGAVRSWVEVLPGGGDFDAHATRVACPRGLAPGDYALIASGDRLFHSNERPTVLVHIQVSNLALIRRDGLGQGGTDGLVVDARSGEPLGGIAVSAGDSKVTAPGMAVDSASTDESGRFHLNGAGSAILMRNGRDALVSPVVGSARTVYPPPSPAGVQPGFTRVVLLTDRAIYRPGQTVHYTGVCIDVDQFRDHYAALASVAVEVVFNDANGQPIERQHQISDAFGSISGDFTAPLDRLTGTMSLKAGGAAAGQVTIQVEQYKRPRFLATLDSPRHAVRLDDSLTVTGHALGYTGAAVGGARVRWRVLREVSPPGWWSWRFWWRPRTTYAPQEIAQGFSTTDPHGDFSLRFVPTPDRIVAREDEPAFIFTVHAEVTDVAGETRIAERNLRIGYAAMSATLVIAEWQERDRPVSVALRTLSMDGAAQSATGVLRVYRLVAPTRVTRDDPPAVPDNPPLTLIHTPPDPMPAPRLGLPDSWPLGERVAERAMTTDSGGRASVELPLAPGLYRAVFETRDREGVAVTAISPLRVLDPASDVCVLPVAEVVAARTWSLEPGQSFELLWGTGYPSGRAFVEVEHRGKLLQAFWTPAGKTQWVTRQLVEDSMRGGFTVRVSMVRENRAYITERHVEVPWTNRQLDVRWEHRRTLLTPGARETWTAVIRRADSSGAGVQVAATLYDASLDAFQRHAWPEGFGVFREDASAVRLSNINEWLAMASAVGSRGFPGYPGNPYYRTFYGDFLALPGLAGAQSLQSPLPQHGGAVGMQAPSGSVKTLEAIEVRAEKRRDLQSSTTKHNITAERLRELPVDNLSQLLATKAGVVAVEDGLHFRGGRGGELMLATGGAPADGLAPLFGGGAIVGSLTAPRVDLSTIIARRMLDESAFFFPRLTADSNGDVRLEFTVPEALTEWRLLMFAHDRDLAAALYDGRAVTKLDLMVQPDPPRFLREGDVIEFPVKLVNLSDTTQTGRVRLTFRDALGGDSRDATLGNDTPERDFEVAPRSARTVAWRLRVGRAAGMLAYSAVASSGKLSDGEEGFLPVLTQRVLVTESLPLRVKARSTKSFEFARLTASAGDSTIAHQSLTVELSADPSWEVMLSLATLMDSRDDGTQQALDQLFANALARRVLEASPAMRSTFEGWRNGADSTKSPLQNAALDAVAIEETPWLRDAINESRGRREAGARFDPARLNSAAPQLLQRIEGLQLADGGWPWFPGGAADDFTTLQAIAQLGRLDRLGVRGVAGPAYKALARMDEWAVIRRGEGRSSLGTDVNRLTPSIALYLYGRSFFNAAAPVPAGQRVTLDYWIRQARQYGASLPDLASRARVAVALKRLGADSAAFALARSLRAQATGDAEGGMSWREAGRKRGARAESIEAHTLMIEALAEVTHDTLAMAQCRSWLLSQKQGRAWGSTLATADAVYALLLPRPGVFTARGPIGLQVAAQQIPASRIRSGDGYSEYRVPGEHVLPGMSHIIVSNPNGAPAVGSVRWQYWQDAASVTPDTGTVLSMHKSLFRREQGRTGLVLEPITGPVHIGDEIVVRIELRAERPLQYVHLKDGRGSGLEPVDVLSMQRAQDGLSYYQCTHDTGTHFYIAGIAPGTYVLEYALHARDRGRFAAGVTEAESLYGEALKGHSNDPVLQVE